MHLVIFDVDGTLVQSNEIDTICFVDAVKQILDLDEVDSDWSKYQYVTDSGIASEIIEKHFGWEATESDISQIRDLFVKKILGEIQNNPHNFKPIPGASEMIRFLHVRDNISIAIATGGWRDSALLKLEAAGIEIGNVPLVSSDDSHDREIIMKLSYEIAREGYKVIRFDSVTYIGDEVWDVVASRNLGYKFIGIGSGDKAKKLRKEGAVQIVNDMTDKDLFFSKLGVSYRPIF